MRMRSLAASNDPAAAVARKTRRFMLLLILCDPKQRGTMRTGPETLLTFGL